jgi:hypothetical protein
VSVNVTFPFLQINQENQWKGIDRTFKLRGALARDSEGEHSHACPNAASSLAQTHLLLYQMSLPRSNYDPRRVCLNPFPEITLGKHRRAMGVYLAGALVIRNNLMSFIVCSCELDVLGCCNSIRACQVTMGITSRYGGSCPCHLRRLDSGHLFFARIPDYQSHR